jgi:hypothetical protein
MKIQGKQLADTLRSESAPFDIVYADRTVGDLNGSVRFTAVNDTGSAIAKGKVVALIENLSGNLPKIILAKADTSAMPAFGITAQASTGNGDELDVVTFGNIKGIDTSSFAVGDTLYVDTTAGEYTTDPPAGSGSKIQNIGMVVKSDSNGIIKLGGAGRSNATPNLDHGYFFIGDSNNQAVSSQYTFPYSDGASGQVLVTNGSGTTTWTDQSAGGTSYTEVTASISEADFTLQDMFIPTDASSGIVINLPTVKNQFTKAMSYDGDRFIVDNKSTYTVQLRIAELSNYNSSVSPRRYEQTYMRHSGNYDATGVYSSNNASGEHIYEIAPMSRVEIEVYQYINTAPSTDIYRVIYNVTSTGGMIGAFYYNYITASQTALTNNIYVCDGTFTLTLPSRDSDFGERIEVKNYGTGTITLDPDLGNINGSATYSLASGSYVTLMRIHLGTNYWITL